MDLLGYSETIDLCSLQALFLTPCCLRGTMLWPIIKWDQLLQQECRISFTSVERTMLLTSSPSISHILHFGLWFNLYFSGRVKQFPTNEWDRGVTSHSGVPLESIGLITYYYTWLEVYNVHLQWESSRLMHFVSPSSLGMIGWSGFWRRTKSTPIQTFRVLDIFSQFVLTLIHILHVFFVLNLNFGQELLIAKLQFCSQF